MVRWVLRSIRRLMASIWIECARWSAKYTTKPRLTKSSKIDPLMAKRGKSSVRAPPSRPTVNRPAAL